MTRKARYAGFIGLLLPLMALAQEAPAPATPAVAAEPEVPALVQVTGISTLVDYAAVGRLLGAAEGVRRVDVTETEGATVTFRVLVRGGSSALDQALADTPQLARGSVSGGKLMYEYRR
jgi:hypothetical protein